MASMPLKRQRSSVATSIMAPSAPIDNLDSVVDVDDNGSQATKSTVIKDQIIYKLQEQNLLLRERLGNEESQSQALV